MLRSLQVALSFMTTLPLPLVTDLRKDDLRQSVRAYPVVGLVIGGLLVATLWAFTSFPASVRGALITGLWLLLTGALHFDGLCDMADAVFVSKTPQERQRIAQDPNLGSYALATGVVLLLCKAASLAQISAGFTLVLIPILARTAVIPTMSAFPVHATSRLGRAAGPTRDQAVVGITLGLLISLIIVFWVGFATWLILIGVAFGSSLLLATWFARRLAGLSGDAYGAIIEITEALLLIIVASS